MARSVRTDRAGPRNIGLKVSHFRIQFLQEAETIAALKLSAAQGATDGHPIEACLSGNLGSKEASAAGEAV